MEQINKIPIVVGATGHRNICADDVETLKTQIRKALKAVQSLCGNTDTPIVMLCGMAQGADMLCAEVAFEMNVPVYAVLPFDKERFYTTFDDVTERGKLYPYLGKCARIIYTPDVERQKDFLQSKCAQLDDDSYWYRQVGVYMAKHAHLMIALWDGKAPISSYGCGTVEVVEFALEHNYLNKDHSFKSGMINDSAVIWIKTNRIKQGKHISDNEENEWIVNKSSASNDSQDDDKSAKYYEKFQSVNCAPDFLKEAVNETIAYNNAEQQVDESCHLWANVDELDEYHKNIRKHFVKADKLSYATNQPKYKSFMLAFAILGAIIALSFLIYDDASLSWMMIPCTVAVGIVIALSVKCGKGKYHANYIKYRALAEALRIQFYLTLSLNEEYGLSNVCDLYSWSQKVKLMWIRKAICAIGVVSDGKSMQRNDEFLNKVKEAWVGNGDKPEGQLRYHTRKKGANKKERDKLNVATQVLTWTTVVLYGAILLLEVVTFFAEINGGACFWSEQSPIGLEYRSIGAIIVGTLAATSLLFSSYWGKLSFDRLYDDNDKMSKLYQSVYSRWAEVKRSDLYTEKEFENFVKEIAREEIVENGIWCSYIEENTLDINL